MEQLELFDEPAYLVHSPNLDEPIKCDTKEQVWDALGRVSWTYRVTSPQGLDIDDFIPF